MRALYVPGPSYYDQQVKDYAGWWNILEYQRQALELAGYEVDMYVPETDVLPSSPSFAKIAAYSMAVAMMSKDVAYDIVVGPCSYAYLPFLFHRESKCISYVWNNTQEYRNRVLEPEYKTFNWTYDHSISGKQIEEFTYALSDRIIACSPFVAKTWQELDVNKDIQIAPWGVDSNMFCSGKKDERFTVVFIGGDPVRKGFGYLLEACDRLNNEGKQVDLIVIGFNGNFPQEWIKNLGMTLHKSVPSIINKCHILVCPTLEDGIACCVQEAMASGVIPISTEDASEVFMHDIFLQGAKPAGFQVDVKNIDVLYQIIDRLRENQDGLPELASHCRQVAETQTWDNFIKAFAEAVK